MRRTRHGKNLLNNIPSPVCRHIQQQIPLFLDGELSVQDARNVASHLANCPLCRREQEQWQQAEQALSGARQRIPAAGDLRTGFYARLAEAPTSRRVFPRIDWRVAVPTLAACGLAFGWLTAQRPVVPDETNRIAAAVPATTKPQIAQADNSHNNNLHFNRTAVGKPAAHANLSFGIPAGKADRHLTGASVVSAHTEHQKTGRRLRRTARRQVALAGSGRNGAESLRRTILRRPADLSSVVQSDALAITPTISASRFVEESLAYTRNSKLDASLFADTRGESVTVLSQARSKKAPQDTEALAKATAKIADSNHNANTYGYAMSAAKAEKSAKLQEKMASPQPTQEAAFDNPRRETFALGLNNEMRAKSFGANGGLNEGAAFGEEEGIVLEVEDSKRGFTSGTRLASQTQEENGKRVLTIRAEDREPLTEDAASAAPGLEPK